jgi:hypothetical protein
MYENKHQPLAPVRVYRKRMFKSVFTGLVIIAVSLMIGVIGYHYTANAGWLDSLHNSSMILSGMGPVIDVKPSIGKWFSSFYALFCGIVFITNIGIILAPAVHRFFHKLHVDNK